jgi:hypothetical protein
MQAPRDENRNTALIATLNTDGLTPTVIYANPTNHAVKVINDVTGSGFGANRAVRDENRITAMLAVSTDGVTLVPIYADNSNNLLIKST